MVFLFFLLFFFLLISIPLSKINFGRILLFFFAFAILFISSGFVTQTPDWIFYEWYFDNDIAKDYIFDVVRLFFKSKNLSFEQFNIFYNCCNCFLLIYFIHYFKRNTFVIVILYYSIIYLSLTTQIRYFLAYPLAIIALYQYFVNKKYLIAALIFTVACLAHSGVVLFIPLLFLKDIEKIKLWKFFSYAAAFNLLLFIFVILFSSTVLGGFKAYLNSELVSSVWGGIFYFSIFILNFVIFRFWVSKYEHLIPSNELKKFHFLLKMATFPFAYIFIAFFLQVIGHRLIVTGILFQILCFFFIVKRLPRIKILKSSLIFTLLYLFLLFYFYLIPKAFLDDDTITTIFEMFRSNPIINYFL